jgi:hypothetical protein
MQTSAKIAKHVLYVAGILSAVYGVGLIYQPAGWIVAGVCAVAISFLIDREKERN